MEGSSLNLLLETGLAVTGAAVGALAAGKAPAGVFGWNRNSSSAMRQRIGLLVRTLPGRRARLLGVAMLAVVMSLGSATAYLAAAPASAARPLETLPDAVIGVIGSGEQIALQVDTENGPVTLHLGDVYARGWVLSALTPSLATFTRGEEVRQVKIRPKTFTLVTGRASSRGDDRPVGGAQSSPVDEQAAQPDSSIGAADPNRFDEAACTSDPILTTQDCAALVREIASERWDGRAHWGLSLADTAQLIALDRRRLNWFTAWFAGHYVSGISVAALSKPVLAQQLGAATDLYRQLGGRREAYSQAHAAEELQRRPITGGSEIYIPAGRVPDEVMTEQGIDPRGVWSFTGVIDANGGRWDQRIGPADYFNPDAFQNAIKG